MEDSIRKAFEEIRMRDEFSDALMQQLKQEEWIKSCRKRQRRKNFAAIAAVLALVTVLLAINPNVVSAVEETVQHFTQHQPRRRMLRDEYLYRDEAVRVKRLKEDYTVHGELPVRVHPWIRIMDGRLYYVDYRDDRIRVDLTTLLSEEEPVYLSFVDDYGMTHYLAVGGSYQGEAELPQTVGFLELLWNPFRIRADSSGNEEPWPGVDDFVTQNSIEFDHTGDRRQWFLNAQEYFKNKLPWPEP